MGLFTKSKKLKFKLIPSTPEQETARNWLQSLYLQDFQAPLQGTADLTPTEQQIQGELGNFQSASGQDYSTAASYYRDVLGGGYDPRTSPAYEGFRQEADALRRRSQQDVARAAQKAGMARSTPVTGIQSRTGAEYDSLILRALGDLYERERDRQTHAAGALPALRGQQIDTMARTSDLAAMPRQLEQHRLDALYQQAMQNLMAPYTYQANIASALLNEQRYAGVQTGGGLTDFAIGATILSRMLL